MKQWQIDKSRFGKWRKFITHAQASTMIPDEMEGLLVRVHLGLRRCELFGWGWQLKGLSGPNTNGGEMMVIRDLITARYPHRETVVKMVDRCVAELVKALGDLHKTRFGPGLRNMFKAEQSLRNKTKRL